MEDHGLIARDVALLNKARGIGQNRSFILFFAIAGIMVIATLVAVIAGGIGGFVLLGGLAGIGAVAKFTPWGENLIIGVVIVLGLIVGALALYGAIGSVFA
jgi:hypothetical protein